MTASHNLVILFGPGIVLSLVLGAITYAGTAAGGVFGKGFPALIVGGGGFLAGILLGAGFLILRAIINVAVR